MKLLPIITIDGPAGVGKTTAAQCLAGDLRLPSLDTGAMFRFIALKLGAEALEWPEEKLASRLEGLNFELAGTGSESILICNNEKAGSQLRTEAIGNLASRLASLPVVREQLRKIQQNLGRQHALIAEGRDMGTVVFPEAALKFFLDASPAVRARRRFLQLREKGDQPDLRDLELTIRQRDERDRSRKIAPLKPAEDAIIIDTSDLALPDVLAKMHAEINRKKQAEPDLVF